MLNGNALEQLSAYIDGALSVSERTDLEARLQADASLRRELARLQATKALIGTLPTLSAPRDLRLTRAMVGTPRRSSRVMTSAAFSALSAAAAVILLVLGAGLFTRTGQQSLGDQAMLNQVAALPTASAPLAQIGVLSDELSEEVTRLPDEQADQEAESSQQTAAEPTGNLPSDQLFLAPAIAPTQMESGDVEPPSAVMEFAAPSETGRMSATAPAAETAIMQLALPSTAAGMASGGAAADTDANASQAESASMLRAAETAAPEPITLVPTRKPSPTAAPTPLPTATPVPVEAVGNAANLATIGIGLMVLAVLLFAVAVVTTVLRRRI